MCAEWRICHVPAHLSRSYLKTFVTFCIRGVKPSFAHHHQLGVACFAGVAGCARRQFLYFKNVQCLVINKACSVYMSADCVFVDPHMHLWDFEEHADVHERRFLAGVRERALSSHYDQEIEVSAFAVRSFSITHFLRCIVPYSRLLSWKPFLFFHSKRSTCSQPMPK